MATTNPTSRQYVRRNYAATQDDGGSAPGADSGAAAQRSGTGRVIGNRAANPRVPGTAQTGGTASAASAAPTAGARLQANRPGMAASRVAPSGASPSAAGTEPRTASSALAARRAYAGGATGATPGTETTPRTRVPISRERAGTGAPDGQGPPQPGDEGGFRRRPSQLVLEREKKTEYWQDVATVAQQHGGKLSGEELNSVISRAMSLGLVGDRKQRESLTGPKAQELFEKLQVQMQQKVSELSGGKQINVDQLVNQNATLMEKIMGLEKTLSVLEKKKSEEEEEEKKKVQNKIGELEKSLKALEAQKREQREQNRRTMKLEIANLKDMMMKVQQTQETVQTDTGTGEAKALSAKMNRLEAALRLMNEERKKDKVEDKETLLLRRKLALFEQKLKEMEEEKKIKEGEEQGNQLRDKLLIMEDKLAKMERRKSMSMTMVMQQKMEAVEKQLSMLRNQSGNVNPDANNQITQKMMMLEKQLKEMAAQKITPGMVNDEETVALRSYIQKLEGSIVGAEKRMDDQRKKIEEERRLNHEKRMREEEEFRRQARIKEEELLKRIAQMESRIKTGGGSLDPAILDRLKALESGGGGGGGGSNPDVSNKITEMERKLMETQKMLEEERKLTRSFLDSAPGEGAQLEAWQKDAQIAWLKQANEQLMTKIQATNELIDKKMEEFKNTKFTGGTGVVHKSGLSYEDINKKLAEIQAKLFDPNTDERESEQLNIEYEKLISELEGTAEYQKEQEDLKTKWKNENAPLNKAAFDRKVSELQGMGDQKLTAVLGRKPELRLLLRTPDQILKQHANDFKGLSTQNLSEDEARALYHNMPPFKKEQEKQIEWCGQLQNKITDEASKPKTKPPPPIPKKKTVVIKKAPPPPPAGGGGGGGGSGGGFLDELLAKRKRRD